MEELLPTSPNLSLPGSIDTIEEVTKTTEPDPFVIEPVDKLMRLPPSPSHINIYQRQGIVLPTSVDIRAKLGVNPEVDDRSKWVPQTEIDIKTALADGHPILFRSTDAIDAPVIGEDDLGMYPATLVGYDTEAQLFTARDDKNYFTIAFAVILHPLLSSDFWTVSA